MEFSKFYKRFILSKVYDPKFIGLKDGQAAHNMQNPYLQNFDRILTLYAQNRNISKEEAMNVALEEFEQLELQSTQDELKKNILDSVKQAQNNEIEWQESGDKEKYPYFYTLDKLNEQMWTALGLPKELLCKRHYMFKKLLQMILNRKQLDRWDYLKWMPDLLFEL